MNFREYNEDQELAAIRAGMNISPEFWQQFLLLANSPVLPELLGVRKEIVATWSGKISNLIKRVKDIDANSNSKNTMIKTGY